jgi:translation initiation factor 5
MSGGEHLPLIEGLQDRWYRYKMEPLRTKVEGKGNGIKTVIVNLTSVAKSVERPRKWILKFFGIELGAQTKDMEKSDRWIINGAHEASKLQSLLYDFNRKFVLCPALTPTEGGKMVKCNNPETVFELQKGNTSMQFYCKACGARTPATGSHKLYGIILQKLNEERKKKEMDDKAARRAAKKAKQNGTAEDDEDGENGSDEKEDENGAEGAANPETNNHDGEDDPELARLRAEVAAVEIAAPDTKDEEETWATEFNDKDVRARADLNQGVRTSDYDKLGFWIAEQNQAVGGIDKVQDQNIVNKIEELGIEGEFKTIQVLARTIFDENIVAQIPKRASLLQQVIDDDDDLEMALITGTERLLRDLRKVDKEIMKLSGKILQLYYQHEIVSEEIIWQWAKEGPNEDSKSSKKFHDGAQKFLELLKEAESEASDDDSE